MKIFFVLLLNLQCITIYGQFLPDSVEKKIIFYLDKFHSGNADEKDLQAIRSITYEVQNKGFNLQEQHGDYKQSLLYIDKALIIWMNIKDTANEANLRKFKGLLLAYLGKFPDAKLEILKAIKLYGIKKIDFGVAVSKFDFSKVYEMESKYDSALYYANQALFFWNTKADTFRILTIKNELINLFIKTQDFSKAKAIQQQCEPLLNDKELYWLPIIDYYFLAYRVYKKLGDKVLLTKYKELYETKIQTLKTSENIEVKSSYED